MIFHKAGKYNGDESILPHKEVEGAHPFKEFQNEKLFSIFINVSGGLLMILLAVICYLLHPQEVFSHLGDTEVVIGAIASCVVMFPHEYLHAICFKGDVYYYEALSKGMLFVIGTEDMSKRRFIFMSMLPAAVLGFIPLLLYFLFPSHLGLAVFGIIGIGSGFGDYTNVFNAIMQVPDGAKIYMSKMHTYWYE